MIALIHSLNVLLPLVYGFSLLGYADSFRTGDARAAGRASTALAVGVLLHAVYLVLRGIAFAHFPITHFLESFSMIAFCVAAIHLVVERRVQEGNTGVFFGGIVFGFQLVSSMFLEDRREVHPLLSNPLFGIHTTLTLVGVAALATSAVHGTLYLMLSKNIRRHRFGVIYDRLPPLDTLEGMARSAIKIGLVVLGAGILLGHLWAQRTLGTFLPIDAKVLTTDALWIAYVAGFLAVRRLGWAGLRMGHFTVWSFVGYFAAMVVLNTLVASFHRFEV